jgi:hypothetical protein
VEELPDGEMQGEGALLVLAHHVQRLAAAKGSVEGGHVHEGMAEEVVDATAAVGAVRNLEPHHALGAAA